MALINTAADIKRHNGAIAHDLDVKNVQSFIDDAINIYIIKAIGRTTFNDLVDGRDTLSDIQKPAFDLIQKACVGYMLAYYAVSGAVQITSAGISVIKGTNSAPASDKKLISLRKDSFEKGFGSLELAVNYLEEFINDFPSYKISLEHKKNRSLISNSSAEFQQAGVNIGNNAQLYQALRTYQVDAESMYIEPLLGDDLVTVIRGLILNGGATPIQTELIERISRPVANFTMMEAIRYLPLSIDSTGVYQMREEGTGENRTPAELNRLANAMCNLQAKGDGQLETLRQWMSRHKDEFTEYTVPTEVIINSDPNSNIYFL